MELTQRELWIILDGLRLYRDTTTPFDFDDSETYGKRIEDVETLIEKIADEIE